MGKPNRSLSLVAEALRGSQVNWNQVFYFSRIAAAGSIKDAAEQLGLSPSTLSLHLSQLEEDLQVQLFHREHRKLTLTAEGSRLFQHAKAMFETGQRLLDAVSPLPVGSYPVSVGLVPSPSVTIANRILGNFLLKGEGVPMKVIRSRYDELERGLAESRFDFGFSDRPPERKDVVSRKVSEAVIQFYVAPKWAGIPFSKLLQRIPLLICNAETNQRSLAEKALHDADLRPASIVTSDYLSTLFELCEQGVGIGVFSEMTFRSPGARSLSSLRAPKDAPRLRDSLYALWSREGEGTMAVRSLLEVLDSGKAGE